MPDFSDVQTGSSSTAPDAQNAGMRTHVVAAGESLSKIAEQEYGDAKQWRRIYDANRDIVKDPDLIYPGQTLKLP